MKSKTIVEFTKSDKGVSVTIYTTETINVMIGIAETIQLISKESNRDKKDIISDINKILDILEEKEEEN